MARRISAGSLSTSARQRSAAPAADGASEPDAPPLDGRRNRGGLVATAGGEVESGEIGANADPGDDVAERTVPDRVERLRAAVTSPWDSRMRALARHSHSSPRPAAGWVGPSAASASVIEPWWSATRAITPRATAVTTGTFVCSASARPASAWTSASSSLPAASASPLLAWSAGCGDEVAALDESALGIAEQSVGVGQTILIEERHLEDDRPVLVRQFGSRRHRGCVPTSARGQRTEAQHSSAGVGGVGGGVTVSRLDDAVTHSFGVVDSSGHEQGEPLAGEQLGPKSRRKRWVMPYGVTVSKHAHRIGPLGIGPGEGGTQQGCVARADVDPCPLGERLGVGQSPRLS